jgi:hypothetical protein
MLDMKRREFIAAAVCWLQRTNVWRQVTSPARRARLLRSVKVEMLCWQQRPR